MADCVLVCTGRQPLLHIDELKAMGINYNRGGIIVDDQQITTCRNIFAIGDVTGGMMLAHRAHSRERPLPAVSSVRIREFIMMLPSRPSSTRILMSPGWD